MSLFVRRLLGIPVPYATLFGRSLPEGEFGQVLDGNLDMPPTSVDGVWSFLNPVRNAVLATFVWKEWSLIDVGFVTKSGVYLAFGDDNVMPKPIITRFIAVKHGREACRFAVLNKHGIALDINVLFRGSKAEVAIAALAHVEVMSNEALQEIYMHELNEIDQDAGGLTPDERAHEAKQCFCRSVNEFGMNLVTFV